MEDIKSPDYEDQEDSQLQDLGLGPKFIPKNQTQAQTVSNEATEREAHVTEDTTATERKTTTTVVLRVATSRPDLRRLHSLRVED